MPAPKPTPGSPLLESVVGRPEEIYRFLVEESSDILAIHDPDGTLRWISPVVERVLGWTPEERMSGSVDLVHPDDRAAIAVSQQALKDGAASSTARLRLRHADGTYRWGDATARAVRDEQGKIVALVIITRDITRQLLIETARDEAEERYRLIAENAADVVFETSADAEIGWITSSVIDVLGWTPEELRGRVAPTLVHPDDIEGVIAGAIAARAGEPSVVGRSRVLRRDGTYRWFAWRQKKIAGASDGSGRLVTALRDIEAEMEAQRALESSLSFYQLLAENASDVVTLVGPGGLITWISPAARRLFGWDPDQVIGTRDVEFIHPDDRAHFLEQADILEESADTMEVNFRLRCGDGRYVWVEAAWRVTVLDGDDGRSRVVRLRDIDAEVMAHEQLALSEEHFRLLAENSSDVVLQIQRGVISWASPSLREALGWSPSDWIGSSGVEYFHPDDLQLQEANALQLMQGAQLLYRVRLLDSDGAYHWSQVHARSYEDPAGQIGGVIATFRIIDDEVAAREALARSEEMFRTAMDSAPTGMAVIDLDRRFLEVNPALCRMLARAEEWLLERRIPDVIFPEDDALDLRMRASVLSGHQSPMTSEKRLIRADGEVLWVEHSLGLLRDDDGVPRGFVSQFVNVTAAREAREELRFMATHDPLTRLVNRPELLSQMDRLLLHAPRTGTQMGALFIDLDDLKVINDTHGHGVGDAVIIEIAERLRSQVRSGDLVARLGGDEFVVLLPAIHTLDDAERITEKLHAAIAEPIVTEATTITVTVSIGVALANAGDSADHILELADRALYQAKRSGKARTVSIRQAAQGH